MLWRSPDRRERAAWPGLRLRSRRAREIRSDVSEAGSFVPVLRLRDLPLPTLGGRQLWADLFICGGWRIQRNVYSSQCRLLDPRNFRRAVGDYERCLALFQRYRRRYPIVRQSGDTVVLVHGLGRWAGAFAAMAAAIRTAGYEACSFNYPSTRQGIAAHADNLQQVIESLEETETVSFVTHSLGGLVVRDLLARDGAWQKRLQVRRVVMIGPPNQGSALADQLKHLPAYQWLTGESGRGLTSEFARRLPIPTAEFGIIAGGRGNDIGFNPLLPGDDDGFVAVEETKLEGARDFLLVNTTHGLLDEHPKTIAATIAFLRHGRFSAEAAASSAA